MFRTILCIAGISCATLANAQTQPPVRDTSAVPKPPAGTAVIRGRVTEAGTNRPLAHALVRVTTSTPGFEKLAATDASGRFEIGELARGTYSIGASKANYLPQNRGEKRPIGPGVPIELADGQAVESVNFALLHAGAVAGRITDEFGEPLPDTQVSLMRWFFTNGERRLQPSGGSAATNDLGEFRVFNVRPGQYIVSATLRANINPMPNATDTGDRAAYAPTFYPSTPNPNDAARVTVGPGQTVTGMSFSLLPVTSARVSGTVVDSQGKPLPNGGVNAMARTNGFGSNGGGPILDGKFALTLTPGDYTLRAMKPGGPPTETETALLDVSVAGADIADLMLVTVPQTIVRGRVLFEPGEVKLPLASSLNITAQPVPSLNPGIPFTKAKDDFTFELKINPGRSIIRMPSSPDWKLRRVTSNGVDITDTGLIVPPNTTIEGIVVELTSHLSRAAVRVMDDSGTPIRDCTVVVFARDRALWTGQSRFVAGGRPNLESTFQPRLPAGEYLVAAFQDDSPTNLWNDPDVLAQLSEIAVPVTIAEDTTKTIDVKLGAAPIY